MVTILSLWLPILLSAVLVFIASSIIHMLLPFHKTDFNQVPVEDDVMEALRKFEIPPGDYFLPRTCSMEEMNSPEYLEKVNQGPVIVMTVMENGPMAMGKSLILWFLYSILVGIIAAYITGRALNADASYLEIFRFVGCTAFVSYSLAQIQPSIWFKRSWRTTGKYLVDGFVYACLTASVFGWLW